MKKFIAPAEIKGRMTAPASKSDMLRAVAAAYLSEADCEIRQPSFCDDALAALDILQRLGVAVERSPEAIRFRPTAQPAQTTLDCGESGLCIRMFPSLAALRREEFTLTGHGSLATRPLDMLEQPLRDLGVECRTRNGLLPVTLRGPLRAGATTLDASTTSQFLTGLLMALPLCRGSSEIHVRNLKSAPYIAMTLHLLAQYGIRIEHENFERFHIEGGQRYRARSYTVEGDWSGAAFPLVAAAVAGGVRVENLNNDSLQADKAVLDALERCGAELNINADARAVEVRTRRLRGFEFDALDCPDLFPPLVALAAHCEGKSVIHGAQRLKVKESDRGAALLSEFTKIGANVTLYADRMEIIGTELDGGAIDSYNDHRIAMACAVAALRSRRGVTIQGAQCVTKSYPHFFEDLEQLIQGGKEKGTS